MWRFTSFVRRLAGVTSRALPVRERKMAVILIFIVVVGVLWAASAAMQARTDVVPRPGGTYREGLVGQPRFISPMLARTNDIDMAITRLVYSGLLTFNAEGQLTGDLAERVDVSEDGKKYTAHLRSGILWHDGEPFTAADVLYTFQTIQNPDAKSPAAPNFQGVTVEKVDDNTVTFTLREPYAPFLYNLTIGIAPEHIWAGVDPQTIGLAEQNFKPVGTGPFVFAKLRKRSLGEILEYELSRNERYHGGAPYLGTITFAFYETNEDVLRAFRRGAVQGMGYVPPSFAPDVAGSRSITVHHVKLPQVFAVFFNQARNQALADRTVRTALDLAADRERLIREALSGEGVRADAPIPEGFLGHVADLGRVPYQPEKAKQNLEEAGWKDEDGDGIRQKGDLKLAFTLVTTDWPEYVTTADILRENWRAIGADVTVVSRSVGTVQTDTIRPRDYDALLYGEVLGADPDPYPFWHSTQTRDPGLNLALYKDRDADKLLEEARKTTDDDKRREIYEKFQERLVESVPALFLYSPSYTYATRSPVHGAAIDALPLPSERFATISSWYVKTRRVWK
jgi:peptide/nickel transport system substrate-binding protein